MDPSTQGNDLLQLKLKESLKVVNKFCEYLHYRTYALYTIYIYTYTYTYIYIYMYIYIYKYSTRHFLKGIQSQYIYLYIYNEFEN